MIDYSKPTAQMLGRWQPFHDGHLALFKEILKKTGQVLEERLKEYSDKFEVIQVPNITNICYGRGVGYEIEEIVLPKEIQKISATKIRQLEIN